MIDQTPESPSFNPRPRSRRKRIPQVSTREKFARLRSILDRLGTVSAEALSDPDGPTTLQVEAAITRANAVVERLPDAVTELLDQDMLRGLNDTRNVAAHGYAHLDPAVTGEIINVHLPDFLDRVEKALDKYEADTGE